MVLKGLLYTKDHEWAKVVGDIATIGITDHAQNQLGELTFVELPEVKKEVQQKGELAVVESTKAASDVYSPVAGKVIEANEQLKSEPEMVNDDCYGAGWLAKVDLADPSEVRSLMNAHQYLKLVQQLSEQKGK